MEQVDRPKFSQTFVSSLYPTSYIVCVIDNLEEAQRAVQALSQASYQESVVRLMDAQAALTKIQELERKRTVLQRLFASPQDVTDEASIETYRAEAKQGHQILYVRADAPSMRSHSTKEVREILNILEAHQAHTVKFFGNWAVEDLPLRRMERH